jgi:fermentation-respiration switch protein FrsA (DUF1100 family)
MVSLGRYVWAHLFAQSVAENMPEVGNGFIAWVVGSDTIYSSGVFNGLLMRRLLLLTSTRLAILVVELMPNCPVL